MPRTPKQTDEIEGKPAEVVELQHPDRSPRAVALGKRIKQRREDLGITQRVLAIRAETDSNSVSRWERGDNEPSERNVQALAAALNVSSTWLRYGPEAPPAAETSDLTQHLAGIEARLGELVSILSAAAAPTFEALVRKMAADAGIDPEGLLRTAPEEPEQAAPASKPRSRRRQANG